MQPCMWTRVRAILLALVFLGEIGGPALDELLYHSKPGTDQVQIHWDKKNGCERHGDHCLLGSGVALLRVPPSRTVRLEEVALDPKAGGVESAPSVPHSVPRLDARPRAPPASPA